MKKILVIGDGCRDVFVYCHATRLAPDLPIPVLQIVRQTENVGMAKNVARNIKAIHKSCDIITNENWRNIVKTRYVEYNTNHAFMRVDSDSQASPIINVRNIPMKKYDIIAISDYDKGFLTENDIRYICERHSCVFVDTKKIIRNFLKDAKFLKINNHEYTRSSPIPKNLTKKIIRTNGENPTKFRNKLYPVDKVEVKDSSGAGDCFFAALTVNYAQTGDIEQAIRFANKCAAQAVQHRGVSVIILPESSN